MFFRRARIAPRSQELVFLDADDDLGTIRSKLEASSAEEIYLVIPRRSSVMRTPLEFRILARIANEMSSETILVTADPGRRRLANQEGFRTRRGLRTLKHLMLRPGQRPPRIVLPDWISLPSIVSFLSFVGVLAVAAFGVLVAYPQMHVTLVPQTRNVNRSVDITIDPDAKVADPSTATLPGTLQTLQVDVSDSLAIPSDRTIGQAKAHGEAIITSQRDTTFSLPKGTTVRVDGGPKFGTDLDLILPPKVPVRVGITAVEAGTASNVGPGQITQFDGSWARSAGHHQSAADHRRYGPAGEGRRRRRSQHARRAAEEGRARQGLRPIAAAGWFRADAARDVAVGRHQGRDV